MLVDKRVIKLFNLLMDHSIRLNSDDVLLISTDNIPPEPVAQLVKLAYQRGAKVMVKMKSSLPLAAQVPGSSDEFIKKLGEQDLQEVKKCTALIKLFSDTNPFDLADVPTEDMARWRSGLRAAQNEILDNKKWVLVMWPSQTAAQMASKSTKAFTDYLLKVCTIDYPKMAKAAEPLAQRMTAGKEVQIKAPGTNLRFSIEGLPGIPCTGEYNIPDGEVFTCPTRYSMEGEITYNIPSTYLNTSFTNVHFKVKEGKIIEATADNNVKKLNDILDTDEGARYFGEWAIGFHPLITEPMNDILFDEKIAGSMHLTPGRAYKECDNGNTSSVHWDLVQIQRPEYGGGEIWIDGELIRKDGMFIPKDLLQLNPENLT